MIYSDPVHILTRSSSVFFPPLSLTETKHCTASLQTSSELIEAKKENVCGHNMDLSLMCGILHYYWSHFHMTVTQIGGYFTDMKPSCKLVGKTHFGRKHWRETTVKYLHDSLIQVEHLHLSEWGFVWQHLPLLDTNQKCFLEKCFQNKYNLSKSFHIAYICN